MKTKLQSHLSRQRLLGIALLCLALNARAQGVFQAHLTNQPQGGGAQLSLGEFYFRVAGDQVDFVAILFPFGSLSSSLDPVLAVPGNLLNFSLGNGTWTSFSGLHSIVTRNPFLPAEPWLPAGFDEDGNPYYIDAPVIWTGDYYSGHFTLPPGFAADLLSGLGSITFNPSLGGTITVAAVPEPTTFALALLAVFGWGVRSRR